MVAGLLSLALVNAPAQANHGSLKLEVYREIASAKIGTGLSDAGVTFTAILTQSNGAPPTSGGTNVEIDWEVEGGPADADGNTPETPDNSICVTPAVVAPGEYPSCTATFKSATIGTSYIRAWIDHDGRGENEGGGTEADRTEGRLSDSVTDCVTESPEPVGEGTGSGSTDRDELTACQSTSDGAVTPGRDAERDETDVVRASFFDDALPLQMDCPEFTLAPTGETAEVRCIISDSSGQRRPNVRVDAKHFLGANDPNGGGPSGDTSADYQDVGASAADGGVVVHIDDDGKGQTGFATICAWVDSDDGSDTDSTVNNNPSYGTSAGDGGDCDVESDEPDTDTPNDNTTDFFRVKWEDPAPTVLDATPEVGTTSVVGGTHTVTATVLDQFGTPWTETNIVVAGEFFDNSPKDGDDNTPASPDLGTCNTTSGESDTDKAACTFTYTSATSPGTDVMCFWFGGRPTMTGSGSGGADCNGERVFSGTNVPAIDVVAKSWTAQSASTTTTTTTPPAEDVSKTQGYTLVGADGGIFNFGTSQFHGSTGDMKLNQPVIGLANKKGGTGYWLVARDGGIFTFGDAEFFGSTGDMKLNAPVLGMEATPSGKGYWLFAADGGIFTFGDAKFYGSTGDMKLNAPAVGLAVNEQGDGYWLVAQDGGIFSFGDVPFHGSTGSMKLNQPVFDMASTAGDKGYWLVAKDGGIFSFGDAENKFYGSAVGSTTGTVIGMGTTPTFNGYWIADNVGGVFPFGDARALGDRRGQTNNAPIVGFATVPNK